MAFKYFNFLGVVPQEFSFHPEENHGWETTGLEWFTLEQIYQMMKEDPDSFHPGVHALFQHSGKEIERLVGKTKQASENDDETTPLKVADSPDIIETFRRMRPFERDRLIEEAPLKEVSPYELKTSQSAVSRHKVQWFMDNPEEIAKPRTDIGLSDTEQPYPLVLETNDGLWLYDGNHRSAAAYKLDLMIEAKVVDLRDYEEPKTAAVVIDPLYVFHPGSVPKQNVKLVATYDPETGDINEKVASASRSWTREQAEAFLKSLPLAETGFSGRIVGGVATKGQSSHDLDILLTPTTEEFDFEKLTTYFEGADQQPTYDGEEEVWEVRLPSGQVVDFFFAPESKTAVYKPTAKRYKLWHGDNGDFDPNRVPTYFTNNKGYAKEFGEDLVQAYVTFKNPLILKAMEGGFEAEEKHVRNAAWRQEQIKKGYDGLIITESDAPGMPQIEAYIPFSSSQIQLIDGKTAAERSWTREQAEAFLKSLPLAETGFSGQIVGGVLNKGQSSHDLDILLTPTTEDFDFEKLTRFFEGADQQPTYAGEEEVWEIRLPSGQVVDFFFGPEESNVAES